MSYTHQIRTDGFGAQYQTIITTYIFCMKHNMKYKYSPFITVAHNYDNDPYYTNKLEELMNLQSNIENNDSTSTVIHFYDMINDFEENIDECCNSESMQFIKECFWKNKERDFFKNNKMNISIHIRRENSQDKGEAGDRANTPNSYYLNRMNEIRQKYVDKELLFHIYSQGNIEDFKDLEKEDVQFHLNEDMTSTFVGLVAADILITSPSSFSYVAALLSDGIIYAKRFWHNPKKEWIVYG
jgi:hypothetical protein